MASYVVNQAQFDEGLREGWLERHPSITGIHWLRRMSMIMLGWNGEVFTAHFEDWIAPRTRSDLLTHSNPYVEMSDEDLGMVITVGRVARHGEHVWQAMGMSLMADGTLLNAGRLIQNTTYLARAHELAIMRMREQAKEAEPPIRISRYEILKKHT